MNASTSSGSLSRSRRIAFTALTVVLVLAFGVAFFGLTSFVIGWFETLEGIAGPVTDLGYGAVFGILLTGGVLSSSAPPSARSRGCSRPRSWCRPCCSEGQSPPTGRLSHPL